MGVGAWESILRVSEIILNVDTGRDMWYIVSSRAKGNGNTMSKNLEQAILENSVLVAEVEYLRTKLRHAEDDVKDLRKKLVHNTFSCSRCNDVFPVRYACNICGKCLGCCGWD